MGVFKKYFLILFFSLFFFPSVQAHSAGPYCGTYDNGLVVQQISSHERNTFTCKDGKVIKQFQQYYDPHWGNSGNPEVIETCSSGLCSGGFNNSQGQACTSCLTLGTSNSDPGGSSGNTNGAGGSTLTYLINDQDVYQNPNLWFDEDKVGPSGAPLRIDGNVRKVKITFKGLESGRSYYLCGITDQNECSKPNPDLEDAAKKKFTAKDGEINIEVCGGGKEWLKGKSTTTNDYISTKNGCDPKNDYFHEGHVYRLGLFQDKDAKANVLTAEFFVKHSFPLIKLAPLNGGKFSPLSPVSVTLWGRRPKDDTKNNYQVIVEGINNNYKQEHCMTSPNESGETVGINTQTGEEQILNGTGNRGVSERSGGAKKQFGRGDGENAGLGQGSFVLKINERVSDSRPLGIGNNCEGGYSYMYVYFRLDQSKPNGINIFKILYDPNSSDLEKQNKNFKKPPLPCENGSTNTNCTAIDTAIGTINTTPQGFIGTLFSFILTIAGTGALVLIIYSGYVFITSRGDKERIAAARETLTSAIVGLLFIIFSIVILETIGVDILQIPGLTK